MNKVRDERIKLFAIYLNTMTAGCFVAGVLSPSINPLASAGASAFPLAYFALTSIVLSGVLHIIAQMVLGRLSP